MFPTITHIDDVRPFIADKPEICRIRGPAGSTTLCYQFQDSSTFDSAIARECRGIVFDRNGDIASRPLHKFFNIGETPDTQLDELPWQSSSLRFMEKLDGSVVHTVRLDDTLHLKTKKSFDNAQTAMAWEWLKRPENAGVLDLCQVYSQCGWTLIFELTSPANRIVVGYEATTLRLLAIREELTGGYIDQDTVLSIASSVGLKVVHEVACKPHALLDALKASEGFEGYVIDFGNGHMVKAKKAWYCQLHRAVSLTRERDIAAAALDGTLDDVKASLVQAGRHLTAIERIETAVKDALVNARAYVESTVSDSRHVGRKEFAQAFQQSELFRLLMPAYLGKAVDYVHWYRQTHLPAELSKQAADIRPDENRPKSEPKVPNHHQPGWTLRESGPANHAGVVRHLAERRQNGHGRHHHAAACARVDFQPLD